MAKSNLPIDVHDHFRKANLLHGYIVKELGEVQKHAIETGQELLAAKACIPHGRWVDECERLFDGSLRTAQFYMAFAKDISVLSKSAAAAVLFLEGTLEGAAKAARSAAREDHAPQPPQIETKAEPEREPEPVKVQIAPPTPSSGDSDPFEDFDPFGDPDHDVETPTPPATQPASGGGKPPKKYDRSFWYKQWDRSIGPMVRLVDKIAHDVDEAGGRQQKTVQARLNDATEEMIKWMGVKR